jgi:hypothetical protein
MVKADDAPKINRLVERFKFAAVDKAKIESEIAAAGTEKDAAPDTPEAETDATGTAPEAPDINDTEELLDALLGTDGGKAAPDTAEPEKNAPERAGTPAAPKPEAKTHEKEPPDNRPLATGRPAPEKNNPSAPTSAGKRNSERATLSRPSVREALREIRAARKAKETDAPKRAEPGAGKQKVAPTSSVHNRPRSAGKPKSRKPKGR